MSSSWTSPYVGPSTTTNDNPTTTTSSSDNASTTPDTNTGPQSYNYFFLLIALVGLAIFLCLVFIIHRRHRLRKKARLQEGNSGRDALARDVESWAGRSPYWGRIRGRNDSILNAGLDERGEAPPDYRAATSFGGDKGQVNAAVPLSEIHVSSDREREVDTGTIPTARLSQEGEGSTHQDAQPPGYDEYRIPGSQEPSDAPARPPTAVVAH